MSRYLINTYFQDLKRGERGCQNWLLLLFQYNCRTCEDNADHVLADLEGRDIDSHDSVDVVSLLSGCLNECIECVGETLLGSLLVASDRAADI